MMRIDNLPEDALAARIRQARQALDDLKTAQRFGSSSVITKRIYSSASFDLQLNYRSDMAPQERLITFTPDDSTFDDLGMVAKMEFTIWDDTGATFFTPFMERRPTVGNVQSWLLTDAVGFGRAWQRYKFYFFTTCAGTFTVT